MKKLLLTLVLACLTLAGYAESFDVTFGEVDGTKAWPNVSLYTQSNTSNASFGGTKWTAYGMANNNNNWTYMRVGNKKVNNVTDNTNYLSSNEAITLGSVTDVVLTVSKWLRGTAKLSLQVSDNSAFNNAVTYGDFTVTKSADAKEYTFVVDNPAPDMYYKLVIETTNNTTSNGVIEISNVKFNYTVGAAPAVARPTFEMVEGEEGFQVKIACETEGAEIYYAMSDESADAVAEPATKYEAPIDVWGTTYFKAVAKVGDETSSVAAYTANPATILQGFGDLLGLEMADNQTMPLIIKAPMTVIYQKAPNTIVNSGYNNMLFFDYNVQTLNAGDTFNRVDGNVKMYYGIPEITDFTLGTVTAGGTIVEPTEATVDMVAAHSLYGYYKISNVTVTVDGKKGTITDADGNTTAMYNQFGITGYDAEEKAIVIGFVGKHNDAVQFWPISIEGIELPVFTPESGSEVGMGSKISIAIGGEGYTIYWRYAGDTEWEEYSEANTPYAIGAAGSQLTIEAYAKSETKTSDVVSATYTIGRSNPNLKWVDAEGNEVNTVEYLLGESDSSILPTIQYEGEIAAEPEFTSSDEAVARIDMDTMSVEVVGAGETVITISLAETATTQASSASYTLKVVDPATLPLEATFDFTNFDSLVFTENAPEEAPTSGKGIQIEECKLVATNDVTLSFVKTSGTGVRIWNSSGDLQFRIYKNSSMTFTAPTGYQLSEIVLTPTSSTENWGLNLSANEKGSFTNKVWTAGEAKEIGSVTFEVPSNGTNTYINSIAVKITKIETAIDSVVAEDEDAPVEYYNLQGVRVANPENGLYIRRQGSKATKVVIR